MGILDFEKEVGNRTFQSDSKFKNSLPDGAFEISTQNPDGSKNILLILFIKIES